MLETKDEQACGEEVQKLVNDFSTNIMKDLKSLFPTTKDDDDEETSLSDMESKGPGGLRSMFMNSISDIDEDEDEEEKEEAKEEVKKEVEKQQEAEKKDDEVVEVTTTAPKAAEDAKNKTIQLQEEEKNEV